MNISLLCKWWWKLEKEDGLWQQIINYKYLRNKTNDSPMWSDLLKVKNVYLQGRGISVKDGTLTRFWQDPWVYDEPLVSHVPVLFELCENKKISVAHALQGEPILFRRWLHSELRIQWEKIWDDAVNFQLEDYQDNIV